VKTVHPLRTERRRQHRELQPPKMRCVFCTELEHTAGRNHDFLLTFPDICQKHHDELTETRRDAGISMIYERNRVKRVALALKSVSVFLQKLAEAMWRWGTWLDSEVQEKE
jgi:hypothetical protein